MSQKTTANLKKAGQRPLSPSLVLFALLLLLLVWGATIAGYNSVEPLSVAADFSPRRVFQGFHAVEYRADSQQPFRWTTGNSTIRLEQIGALPPASVLRISLLGYTAVQMGINEITMLMGQQTIATVTLTAEEPRHYDILFRHPANWQDDLHITLSSRTAHQSGDLRQLGVSFHSLELHPLFETGLVWPAKIQLVLNLALAAMCYWLLVSLGVATWLSSLIIAIPTLFLGSGVVTGLITPGMDITRNLLPLVGTLGLLSVGTLAIHLVRRSAFIVHLAPLQLFLMLMVFWSVVLWSASGLLQLVYGHSGVWPLKAGIWPGFTPLILIPLVLFTLWLTLVLLRYRQHLDRTLTSSNISGRTFIRLYDLLLLLAGGFILPTILKLVVRGWDSLFYTFGDNRADYIHDVPLVDNPLTFMANYVELSPTLSLHSSTHPPGNVLFLWLVEQALGSGAVPATWVAIALSSLIVVAAFWAGLRLGGASVAFLAAALTVVMPGHQMYSVTSMDGVFNVLIACGAVAFFIALEPSARPWQALLAGGLIALGLFFTYATTQLFFFGLALIMYWSWTPRWADAWRQASIAAGVLIISYLLIYLITDFNVIAGAFQATANNARLMGDPNASIIPNISRYVYAFMVNAIPFAWYLAPWGLAAITPLVLQSISKPIWMTQEKNTKIASLIKDQPAIDPAVARLSIAVLTLVMGMLLSGLFVREVERIWSFVYPLIAVLIAYAISQDSAPRDRLWRAGLWISLFFIQSAIMRMWLNTYW